MDFSFVHPLPCRWELEGPSQQWSLTLLTLVSCTLRQLPALPPCRILMAILSGSSPAPRTGSKNTVMLWASVSCWQKHYREQEKQREICLSLICESWASCSPCTCPLSSEFQRGPFILFFVWNGVVGRKELFTSGEGLFLMLLTSWCTWVSGGPVDFLSCLFLTHHKALCPGDLLTSTPASSAAACQMAFTGQFIVLSMLLHKCYWLQARPAIRVMPIHPTELLVLI